MIIIDRKDETRRIIQSEDNRNAVMFYVKLLPKSQKRAVELRYLLGRKRTIKEIAAINGCSLGNVSNTLRKAEKRLRELMSGKNISDIERDRGV